MSREAVIVSTARTPIGKAFRGAFNNTHGATLAGHAIKHAVERSGLEPDAIEDVIIGCGLPEGATGHNIARMSAIRAGLPVTAGGTTVNRFCSSGMQAISMAAQRVVVDKVPAMVAGGLESISLVQNNLNTKHFTEDWLMANKPELWMSMIDTADTVAKRYSVSREVQDEYALSSQMRTAAAQQAGKFDDEIVPLPSVKIVTDKETGRDLGSGSDAGEGRRQPSGPPHAGRDWPAWTPSSRRGSVTSRPATQASFPTAPRPVLSWTASAAARKQGIEPMGDLQGHGGRRLRAGRDGDRSCVRRAPKLLERNGLTVDDIDLWELNEAFAVQVIYCRDKLGIDNGEAQCRWRLDLDRPSLWHVRRADDRPRPDRRQTPRRQERGLHHVHRRRHGRGRAVRGGVRAGTFSQLPTKYSVIPASSRDPLAVTA